VFDGFTQTQIETSGARINLRYGGTGPPLLLLHGNPLTHVMWHKIAPRLAQDFTVVAADLRGYGDSSKPDGGPDHAGYSFRAMAQDQVEVMQALGFDRYDVCGHDRGARVAHRMALDHPRRVRRVAMLDIVPTHHVLHHISAGWAVDSYHWFFMAQPYDYPEQMLIAYGLERYIRRKLDKKGVGMSGFDARGARRIHPLLHPREHPRRMRGLSRCGVDRSEHDEADLDVKLSQPLLVLWGERSHVNRSFRPIDAWLERALDVRGKMLSLRSRTPAAQEADETYKTSCGRSFLLIRYTASPRRLEVRLCSPLPRFTSACVPPDSLCVGHRYGGRPPGGGTSRIQVWRRR
jgi:haloacetate dehalogenase